MTNQCFVSIIMRGTQYKIITHKTFFWFTNLVP